MIDFRRVIPSDTRLGQALRLPLKLVPPNVVLPILSGPLKGLKWLAGAGNHGCWLGTYELAAQQWIAHEAGTGNLAFDLGANHGFFTMLLGRRFRSVVAIEPYPPNISILRKHLAINGFLNCEILCIAAAGTTGSALFAQGPNHATGKISEDGTMEVTTISLEDLVRRFGPASMIKMDVEGAELEVLSGGAAYLKECRPKLFVSTHGRDLRDSCVTFLKSIGYALQIDNYDLAAW